MRSLSRQRGVTLISGLIMVLLISIIAMASMRGSGLQEAMAGNLRERNIAFQSGESALSDGESTVDLKLAVVTCTKSANACVRTPYTGTNAMIYRTYATLAPDAITTALGLTNVASQPIYAIETLPGFQVDDGTALEFRENALNLRVPYRVSSIGVGATTESQIMVQSTLLRMQ